MTNPATKTIRDIKNLVPPENQDLLESLLKGLGYELGVMNEMEQALKEVD